jgi:hypothetical protein
MEKSKYIETEQVNVSEDDRRSLLEHYKTKIGEHVTYWMTASVALLTTTQLKSNCLLIIAILYYIGFSIYLVGRIFYWETYTSYLMSLVKHRVIFGEEYTSINLIQYTLNLKMDEKRKETLHRRFGKGFQSFNMFWILMLIFSLFVFEGLFIAWKINLPFWMAA